MREEEGRVLQEWSLVSSDSVQERRTDMESEAWPSPHPSDCSPLNSAGVQSWGSRLGAGDNKDVVHSSRSCFANSSPAVLYSSAASTVTRQCLSTEYLSKSLGATSGDWRREKLWKLSAAQTARPQEMVEINGAVRIGDAGAGPVEWHRTRLVDWRHTAARWH